MDPARHQDANGGSGGGGHLNTPSNGLNARDSSRSPRGQRNKMEEDEPLFLKDGEKKNTGKKKK